VLHAVVDAIATDCLEATAGTALCPTHAESVEIAVRQRAVSHQLACPGITAEADDTHGLVDWKRLVVELPDVRGHLNEGYSVVVVADSVVDAWCRVEVIEYPARTLDNVEIVSSTSQECGEYRIIGLEAR